MLNLVLHCGSNRVDRELVQRTPTPARTETWVPIPHYGLLRQVEHTLVSAGLRVINQAHALSPDTMRYFALLEVINGMSNKDYGLVLGIRNSHDQRFPAGLVVGSGVFVCDNMSFSGEVKIARRHTVNIERDLPGLVAAAVGMIADLRRHQDQRIVTYKQTELTDPQAHDLMIRSLDARVIPVTHMPEVIREWRTPRHPEFAECGKTAWRLFNATTEAIKGSNLDALPRRTQALHGLLDAACGLQAVLAGNN